MNPSPNQLYILYFTYKKARNKLINADSQEEKLLWLRKVKQNKY